MLAANRRAALDLYTHHLANRPRSRILAGRSFLLGGSTAAAALAPGVHSGDLSGIGPREMSRWVRRRYFPPDRIGRIEDWERKVEAIARAVAHEDIRAVSGTPSWLLILFDRLAELRPERGRRLAGHFPNLEMLAHGGVNFAPYRHRFAELLEGSGAETREVYAASEGYFANADRGDGEGMRLIVDNGLFYEFVETGALDGPDPARRWLGDVETGVDYAIVVTSCAGLWAHVVGDTVAFTDLDPPRLLVTGRTAYTPVGLRRASHRRGDRPGGGPGGGGDRRRRQRLFGGAGVPGGARRARRPRLCRRVRRRRAGGRGARALCLRARPLAGAGQRRLRRPPRRRLRGCGRPACMRWRRAPSPPG